MSSTQKTFFKNQLTMVFLCATNVTKLKHHHLLPLFLAIPFLFLRPLRQIVSHPVFLQIDSLCIALSFYFRIGSTQSKN